MYLRRVTRRNRDGSQVSYVQLAHNVWDPVRQCSVTQVIHNFGREDQLDREALQRLARSITRFLDPEQALAVQAPEGTSFLRAVPMGGAWLLDHLWRRLGVAEAIARMAKRRRVTGAVERLIFCLVANRALDPMSKLAALEWAQNDTWLPGVGELGEDPQIFYRSMDFLLACDEEVQREVFFAVSDLLNLEVDLILFDTTSTYFEIPAEREDELRKFGESKDKRWDLPQVVVGFAVTKEGIPVRCFTYPGNASDQEIIREVKDKLRENGMSLSGGQQQRLCIARALAVGPEVLLMDEPASALDPIATLRIEELIAELKQSYTIVIVTHNMQQAARVSDRTAFLTMGEDRAGYLVEVDDTSRIFTNPSERLTEDYVSGRFG